jgi:hypothetical protein
VRSLLPEIELERQRLAEWALAHRRALSSYWARQDVLALEIGPLCKLINETAALRAERTQFEAARWLRDARNSLSHWQVIDLKRLRDGRRILERARKQDAASA